MACSRRRCAPAIAGAFALLAALLALAAACGGATEADGTPAASGSPTLQALTASATAESESEPPLPPAPELTGLTGWVNSAPTSIAELVSQGRVVLIDFWTYTCINCIRTLPYLVEWDRKYRDRGLTILGIHSPEFDFERDAQNVAAAIERHGIEYPVAQDNDFATWRAFSNRFWPAKYLIGAGMVIRYQHFGEGDYLETEQEIRDALEDAGWNVDDIPLGSLDDAPQLDPDAGHMGQTRELYLGFERNYHPQGIYAAQKEYYDQPDAEVMYHDIDSGKADRSHNQWYAQGLWRNEREAFVHARETEDLEDYVALRMLARSVNVVVANESSKPYRVYVELDGRPLKQDEAGDDVRRDDQGRTYITVHGPDVYRIVELPEFGDHEVRLRCNSKDFAIFAFTFGSYTDGA
jgi:thiol-disulfide isomerase/thioredoxin